MLNISVGLKIFVGLFLPIRNQSVDDGVDDAEHLIVGFGRSQIDHHLSKSHQCDDEGNPIFDEEFFHITSVSS